jgi:hypothetical protein
MIALLCNHEFLYFTLARGFVALFSFKAFSVLLRRQVPLNLIPTERPT